MAIYDEHRDTGVREHEPKSLDRSPRVERQICTVCFEDGGYHNRDVDRTFHENANENLAAYA
jgi:hypothetical protein